MAGTTKFLTLAVLDGVLAERRWPAPYTLTAEGGGFVIALARCKLSVVEGERLSLSFLPASTGLAAAVPVERAVRVVHADPEVTLSMPTPIPGFRRAPCVGNVQIMLRKALDLLFTYFPASLVGDFAWVAAYRARAGG